MRGAILIDPRNTDEHIQGIIGTIRVLSTLNVTRYVGFSYEIIGIVENENHLAAARRNQANKYIKRYSSIIYY